MLTLILAMAAFAQTAEQPSDIRDTLERGGKIISQPAQDVGATKMEVPAFWSWRRTIRTT
jgi:hypothetical protein